MRNRVRIHITKRGVIDKGFRVVSGFKGFGAVGIISALHIINELNMQRIGVITTKYNPEYVFRDDYGLAFPFEIFASKEHRLVVIATRELPDERVRDEFVYEITNFIKKYELSPLVLIGGLDRRFKESEEDRLRWLKNSYYQGAEPKGKALEKGLLIVGPLALQLMYAELLKIPSIVLLPYTIAEAPDPAAAAIAISELNSMFGLNMRTDRLIEEGIKIQEELKRLEEELSASRQAGKDMYI